MYQHPAAACILPPMPLLNQRTKVFIGLGCLLQIGQPGLELGLQLGGIPALLGLCGHRGRGGDTSRPRCDKVLPPGGEHPEDRLVHRGGGEGIITEVSPTEGVTC